MAKKKKKKKSAEKPNNLKHLVQVLSAVGDGKPFNNTDLGKVVIRAVGDLRAMADWSMVIATNCQAIANALGDQFGLSAEPLTGLQCEKYLRDPQSVKGPTPFGEARVPPAGEPPEPKDGENYTAEELSDPGVFSRAVLARVVAALGGESKGMMAPALRSQILTLQERGKKVMGECEVTGDEDVELVVVTHEGEDYRVGPRPVKVVEDEETDWDDIFSGEFEFD